LELELNEEERLAMEKTLASFHLPPREYPVKREHYPRALLLCFVSTSKDLVWFFVASLSLYAYLKKIG